ncbi:hypothetical protein [Paenibacillus sp. L3-i20]|uniref:hypothetical protein n=1 Tax=Paenibacillus sp. L3-i20 TaxID=2905833 RepID=UPI0020C032EB|nr:hypothetical protein [Paenibacillus sp. L3-i20]
MKYFLIREEPALYLSVMIHYRILPVASMKTVANRLIGFIYIMIQLSCPVS